MTKKIDFVIPWVDGGDPEWQKEKKRYEKNITGDSRDIRYRDLDNLRYWFRGVERFAPWVNRIHFITWGHLPKWLNREHPKLNIVLHGDYIPKRYLPTFSTRPIELNIHRIKGLTEQFVYFNDDMFITQPTKKSDFFKDGLPRDIAVLRPLIGNFRKSTTANIANVMEIINTTYEKNKVIRQNLSKWFNLTYRKFLISTLLMMPYRYFSGFLNLHLPNSYLKKTFEELWKDEYDVLDATCKNKFRTGNDVNQQLPKYKQLMEGTFIPRSPNIGKTYHFTNDNTDIINALEKQKYKLICINDNGSERVRDFEKQKEVIQSAFDFLLPGVSSFEI